MAPPDVTVPCFIQAVPALAQQRLVYWAPRPHFPCKVHTMHTHIANGLGSYAIVRQLFLPPHFQRPDLFHLRCLSLLIVPPLAIYILRSVPGTVGPFV